MSEKKEEFDYNKDEIAAERERRKAAKETSGGERKALWALIALVAAIIIFVVLTIIQRNIVNAGEKVSIIVANAEVPAGVTLTQETVQQFFTMQARLKSEVPANSFTSGHQIVGMITARKLSPNEVLTSNALKNENYYKDIEDPVELSIDVSKLSHAVSGTLRAGDLVDLKIVVDMSYLQQEAFLDGAGDYSLDGVPNLITGEENEGTGREDFEYSGRGLDTLAWRALSTFDEDSYSWSPTGKYACVPIASDVRVIDVYTAAGEGTAQVESQGTAQIATVFTIVVDRSMEDLIYLALEEGTMQVARIIPEEEKMAAEERVNPAAANQQGQQETQQSSEAAN